MQSTINAIEYSALLPTGFESKNIIKSTLKSAILTHFKMLISYLFSSDLALVSLRYNKGSL